MLDKAEERGFNPEFVLFDTWYANAKNLKPMRKKEWHFLTRLKNNRLVNSDNKGNLPLKTIDIPPKGSVVHLKTYGFVKVFRIVLKDGDTQQWVRDVQEMDEAKREYLGNKSWKSKEYHRGIKAVLWCRKMSGKKGRVTKSTYNVLIKSFP